MIDIDTTWIDIIVVALIFCSFVSHVHEGKGKGTVWYPFYQGCAAASGITLLVMIFMIL